MHRKTAIHLVAVLAALVCFASTQQPTDPRQTANAAANAAYQAKDWPAAEKAFCEAARLEAEYGAKNPRDQDSADRRNNFEYNAACCAALAGRSDAAFELLGGMLKRKWYDNNDALATDKDLDSLRGMPAKFDPLKKRARDIMDAATKGHAEGKILVPKGKSKSKPTAGIVALHGGGGNIEGWEKLWQPVADRTGAVIILVRGSLVQDPGVFSYNQGVPDRDVARIEEWIAKAKAQVPTLDDNELFLAGFSQGGGMAWVLGIEGNRAWRGIIPMGGYVQVALRKRVMADPIHSVAAYAIVGDRDEEAIRSVNKQLADRKDVPNLRAQLEVVQGAGHALPPDLASTMERAMQWCRSKAAATK